MEIPDPQFSGIEDNTNVRCHHGELPERKVAFDMAATGRRFLGCPRKGNGRCSFVLWVDNPWPPVLARAILHLWSLADFNVKDNPNMNSDRDKS